MKKISHFKDFFYGQAPIDNHHVEIPKTFNETLKSVYFIMYNYHVNILHKNPKTMRVNKKIYGTRKIVHK
ncbi:hypothetical protein KAU39_03805 [bacterium]|nr:hypothetical protein [bacterium]